MKNNNTILVKDFMEKLVTTYYYELQDNNIDEDSFYNEFNLEDIGDFINYLLKKDSNWEQIMYIYGKYYAYTIKDEELNYSIYKTLEDKEKTENSTDGKSYNLDWWTIDLDMFTLEINNKEKTINILLEIFTEYLS